MNKIFPFLLSALLCTSALAVTSGQDRAQAAPVADPATVDSFIERLSAAEHQPATADGKLKISPEARASADKAEPILGAVAGMAR